MTRSRQPDEAITTNDCYGSVSLPPGSIEWSRGGSVIGDRYDQALTLRRIFVFKSAAIGGGIASDDDRAC